MEVRRTAPFQLEPGFHEPSGLWFFGNVKLLHSRLAHLPDATGPGELEPRALDVIERDAERHVLESTVIVCGVHNGAHQRAALVPLRWGAPRIVVFSGGFHHHLGKDLTEEPFRAARLWRYAWDKHTDLAVSRRSPDRLPTFARNNPTVDRLIAGIALGTWPGLRSPVDSLTPPLGTIQ